MNVITLDYKELEKQQRAIIKSDIDKTAKEGLNNLISTVLSMAEHYETEDEIEFVMKIPEWK